MLYTLRAQTAVYSAATDHGELVTLVAGMRWSALNAGEDDEVYDKKPLYVTPKTTEQHCSNAVVNLKSK